MLCNGVWSSVQLRAAACKQLHAHRIPAETNNETVASIVCKSLREHMHEKMLVVELKGNMNTPSERAHQELKTHVFLFL